MRGEGERGEGDERETAIHEHKYKYKNTYKLHAHTATSLFIWLTLSEFTLKIFSGKVGYYMPTLPKTVRLSKKLSPGFHACAGTVLHKQHTHTVIPGAKHRSPQCFIGDATDNSLRRSKHEQDDV